MNWRIYMISLFLILISSCPLIAQSGSSSDELIIIEGDTLALIPVRNVRTALFLLDNRDEQIRVMDEIIRQQKTLLANREMYIDHQSRIILIQQGIISLMEEKEKNYLKQIDGLENLAARRTILAYVVGGVGLVLLIFL